MKQINKTGELKERITNIANKSFHEIWNEFKRLKEEFLNMEIDNDLPVDSSHPLYIRSFNILNDICETLMEFWNWAHDIYALARMCKTYISGNIMFYGGRKHTQNLINLLKQLNCNIVEEYVANEGEFSCLRIPKKK